ncbi:hypothetical protein [Aquidulcibacter sp.]|jgi:hypothetical protein|uniref:hypothetical protein n=1 Tax=Aquidulcibacter sp. TaxID=2052990 RepID=UPI0025B9A101|nr:hypothetical protein [Aquidulcibacter sp.]MCA3696314.1 hypothetical protein [Aquidulcibacter sp.]
MSSFGLEFFFFAFWAILIVVVFVVGVIILLDVSTLLKLKIKQNQVKLNAMIKDQKS